MMILWYTKCRVYVKLCQEVKPFAKFGLLRMVLESHSHVAITAVWLFLCLIAFTLLQKPFSSILWVSVSYITWLSSRNQDIKAPDIRPFQASYLVVLGVKCKMETTITEFVRQTALLPVVVLKNGKGCQHGCCINTPYNRKHPSASVAVHSKRKVSVKTKSGCEGIPHNR